MPGCSHAVTVKVVRPLPNFDVDLGTGDRGRLLVLLDMLEPASTGDPSLSAQHQTLKTLLDREGWSYTLVDNPQAFADELYSGGYLAYAILLSRPPSGWPSPNTSGPVFSKFPPRPE